MRSKKEIKNKIIEIATKMDEAKANHELTTWYILNDKKILLEWILEKKENRVDLDIKKGENRNAKRS